MNLDKRYLRTLGKSDSWQGLVKRSPCTLSKGLGLGGCNHLSKVEVVETTWQKWVYVHRSLAKREPEEC